MEICREAIAIAPIDFGNRCALLTSLASALKERFKRDEAEEDLDEAITSARDAVAADRADTSVRGYALSQLGSVLEIRWQRSGSRTDLEDAIAAGAEIAGMNSASPLKRARSGAAAGRRAARTDPKRAALLLEGAVRLLPQVALRDLKRQDQQALIAELDGLASEAASVTLMDTTAPPPERLLPLVILRELERQHEQALIAELDGLAPETSVNLKVFPSPQPEQAERALQLLESGRTVLTAQILHTRTDLTDLTEQHPGLADRFAALRDRLHEPAADKSGDAGLLSEAAGKLTRRRSFDYRQQIAAELSHVLKEIRGLDGFSSFARPPSIPELRSQAAEGPVVTFNVTAHRGDALILTPSGVTCLPLSGLTLDRLTEQVDAFQGALTASARRDADRSAAHNRIRQVLAWLWEVATEPVLNALGFTRGVRPGEEWRRVWWVTTGLLNLLPPHAAGYHTLPDDSSYQGRTVLDRVISSYTPTITALRYARQRTLVQPVPERALIVAMPTTPGLPDSHLPQVEREARLLRPHFPALTLLSEHPTTAAVLQQLPSATIAHFACHARSDPTDPSASKLLLQDWQTSPLTVTALSALDLRHARLAYLSACSTAVTLNPRLLDESIHLTSAFQLAGFPHVIGTLWPIHDRIAANIADAFYRHLRTSTGQLDTDHAARALHETIREFRDQYPAAPSLWASYIHTGT